MHILRIGAAFLALAVASGAWAAEVTIGGVPITLPVPAGFCELSADHSFDIRMQTDFGGSLERTGSRLLAISADCRQLADTRAGKRVGLGDYGGFGTAGAGLNR